MTILRTIGHESVEKVLNDMARCGDIVRDCAHEISVAWA